LPLSTVYVDEVLHRTVVATILAARKRDVSLLDLVSFEVLRRLGITTAFTFDDHFNQFGFRSSPS
jgi:predicted nucleic acid-binding protein